MGKKVAVIGVGAVGGYTGAHMVRAGEDVTFIDMWPAHVDEMKKNGLRITHRAHPSPTTRAGNAFGLEQAEPATIRRLALATGYRRFEQAEPAAGCPMSPNICRAAGRMSISAASTPSARMSAHAFDLVASEVAKPGSV